MFIISSFWKTGHHPTFSSPPFIFFATQLTAISLTFHLYFFTFHNFVPTKMWPPPLLIWLSQRSPVKKNPTSQIQWLLCCPHSLNLAMVLNGINHFFFLASLFFNLKIDSFLFLLSPLFILFIPSSSICFWIIDDQNSSFCSILALHSFLECF